MAFFNGYEKIMSLGQTGDSVPKKPDSSEPEGGMVIFGVTYSSKAFRLIGVYAP